MHVHETIPSIQKACSNFTSIVISSNESFMIHLVIQSILFFTSEAALQKLNQDF